jgi:hypothetical protein
MSRPSGPADQEEYQRDDEKGTENAATDIHVESPITIDTGIRRH